MGRNSPISGAVCLFACAVVALAFPTALALNTELPPPPPRGTFVGPLIATNAYSGGILVVAKPKRTIEADRDDHVLGRIVCSDDKRTVEVEEKAEWGLSLMGPVSEEQTEGIIEATKDLRPPERVVKLTYDLQGDKEKNRTWTHTKTKFEVSEYEIYAVREVSPAKNELIGILVVEVPTALVVDMTETGCPAQGKPKVDVPPTGEGFLDSFGKLFRRIFVDLPNKIGLYTFGTVKVVSSGGTYGAAHLRSGETASFGLPEGSFTVRALVRIIGIPIEWSIGSVTGPAILIVTLTAVEVGAYILVIVLIVIVIFVVYKLLRRAFGGRAGRSGGGGQGFQPPSGGGSNGL